MTVPLRTEGLYAILDVDAFRRQGVELAADGAIEAIARALLDAGPSAVQLRAKSEGAATTLALLRRLRPLAAAARVAMVVNDRIDLALIVDADCVHVGQEDFAVAEVRRIAPSLAVGVSTHDAAQLDAAISARPAYVAFGPVFGTRSKEHADPVVGVDGLAKAAARARAASVPLVAIGGIDRQRASALSGAGVRWAAIISELVAVDAGRADLAEITRRARFLDSALRGAS